MPDSHHYMTVAFDPQTEAFSAFKLFHEIGLWLDATVMNGWEYVERTGEKQGGFNPEAVDWHTETDPLTDAYVAAYGTGGTSFVQNPTELTSQQSKTVYFRWSDGTSETWENYFYLSTLKVEVGNSGPLFTDIRCGYLTEAHQAHIESPTAWGSTYFDDAGSGWFIDPAIEAQDPTIFGYSAWPTGFSAPDTRSLNSPYSYKSQPGYDPEVETVTTELIKGQEYAGYENTVVTCHVFAGVENGAPYLYCTIESGEEVPGIRSKIYTHFGVGRLAKIGDWVGGQFSVGQNWQGSSYQMGAGWGDEYVTRLFDSWSTRFVGNRNMLAYSKKPATRPQPYRFGYYYNNYPYWATGTLFNSSLGAYWRDDCRLSTDRNRPILIPNYVQVNDIDEGSNNYGLLLGIAPGVRGGWISQIHEGDEFVQDGATWKAFPIRSRNNSEERRTGDYGFFFRKA